MTGSSSLGYYFGFSGCLTFFRKLAGKSFMIICWYFSIYSEFIWESFFQFSSSISLTSLGDKVEDSSPFTNLRSSFTGVGSYLAERSIFTGFGNDYAYWGFYFLICLIFCLKRETFGFVEFYIFIYNKISMIGSCWLRKRKIRPSFRVLDFIEAYAVFSILSEVCFTFKHGLGLEGSYMKFLIFLRTECDLIHEI